MIKKRNLIANISFSLNYCNKVNAKPISKEFISSEPLVNIYKNQQIPGRYIVNILSHIPLEKFLNKITEPTNSGLYLNNTKTLHFGYGGVSLIKTDVNTAKNEGDLLCRVFEIDYNSDRNDFEEYDLYQIQIEYNLVTSNAQSAEAVIVHDINLDPESDRGTVVTPIEEEE